MLGATLNNCMAPSFKYDLEAEHATWESSTWDTISPETVSANSVGVAPPKEKLRMYFTIECKMSASSVVS